MPPIYEFHESHFNGPAALRTERRTDMTKEVADLGDLTGLRTQFVTS